MCAVLLDAGGWLPKVQQSVITCVRGLHVVVLGAGSTADCGACVCMQYGTHLAEVSRGFNGPSGQDWLPNGFVVLPASSLFVALWLSGLGVVTLGLSVYQSHPRVLFACADAYQAQYVLQLSAAWLINYGCWGPQQQLCVLIGSVTGSTSQQYRRCTCACRVCKGPVMAR